MSNAYTDTVQLALLIEKALDRSLRFELQSVPIWRQFIDVRPSGLTNPGSPARMYVHDEITEQTDVLDEIDDPDSVALPAPRTVDIEPNAYGFHTIKTLRVEDLGLQSVVALQARAVMRNMMKSIDLLVMRKHDAGTLQSSLENAVYVPSSVTEGNIKSTDHMNSDLAANTVALLSERNVEPKMGETYLAVVHPFVARDIKREGISNGSWTYALANGGDLGPVRNGYIGTWQGAHFVETKRVRVTGTGDTSCKVFTSYFLGREFLAEYVVREPGLVIGSVGADAFRRKAGLGWYGDLGWATYRNTALQKVKTSATQQSSATVTI